MKNERKERIYEFINRKEYVPLKKEELGTVLCVPKEDFGEFEKILDELTKEGRVYLTKKKRYEKVEKDIVFGTLSCNAYGFYGFLRPDDESEEDVFISGEKLADALHNDKVLARIDIKNTPSKRREGHIIKIIERKNHEVTGVIKKERKGTFLIETDDKRIYKKIIVGINDVVSNVGDRVLVKILQYEKDFLKGEIVENLGDFRQIKSQVEAIIREYKIEEAFMEETIKEAESAKKRVYPNDIKDRLDLTDKMIFTIDSEDARDFDDAVSIEMTKNKEFLLGVHIADVDHYVKEGTFLDKDAFSRGTSVYLADRVIPMLPVELSNGICSLNPGVKRLTLSVFMRINKKGEVNLESINKSVILSKERLTYNNVAKLLENPDEKLLKRYSHILSDLKLMEELARILHKKREERGAINFDFPEAKVVVNDLGEPTEIIKEERLISHKIIEEFMLVANQTVAEFAFWAELPFVYRAHEAPSLEKTKEFNRFLYNFGMSLKGKFDEENPVHPKAFSEILKKIKGMPEETMISTYMLRSLMKADYRADNPGHFGLCAKYYCHFTSPIRRYPDLIVHRILKKYISQQSVEHFKTEQIAKHSSDKELGAKGCEMDVDDLMKAHFMMQFVGEEFSAIISSITNFGMFVQLQNTVEGLIRLSDMKDDYYEFIEEKRVILGKRTNKVYKIGDEIEVVLVSSNPDQRQIDFVRKEDFSNADLKRRKNPLNKEKKNIFQKKKRIKKRKR